MNLVDLVRHSLFLGETAWWMTRVQTEEPALVLDQTYPTQPWLSTLTYFSLLSGVASLTPTFDLNCIQLQMIRPPP